jgi:hypothetical protein
MSEEADGNTSTVNTRALLPPRTRKEYKCQFHPGHYRRAGVTCASGMAVGWSCCKTKDENTPGCNFRMDHMEDAATTACLQPFTQLEESDMSNELPRRLAEGELLEKEERTKFCGDGDEGDDVLSVTGVKDGEKQGYGALMRLHHVAPTDTLVGLSLRYGISTQRIREVNSIMGSSIVQAQILKSLLHRPFHDIYVGS